MRTRVALLFLALTLIPLAAIGATGLDELERPASGTATTSDEPVEPAETMRAAASEPPTYVPQVRYPETLFVPATGDFGASVDLPGLVASIEADRRLLSELRKGVPDTREEAEFFLRRLKLLADRADPVRLAIRADRVLEQAPIYFDWLETEFESSEESLYDYYVGGAQGFQRALEEFEEAVLLVVINRLDTASRLVQEAYAPDEEEEFE